MDDKCIYECPTCKHRVGNDDALRHVAGFAECPECGTSHTKSDWRQARPDECREYKCIEPQDERAVLSMARFIAYVRVTTHARLLVEAWSEGRDTTAQEEFLVQAVEDLNNLEANHATL